MGKSECGNNNKVNTHTHTVCNGSQQYNNNVKAVSVVKSVQLEDMGWIELDSIIIGEEILGQGTINSC